jgi:hypothetical protein
MAYDASNEVTKTTGVMGGFGMYGADTLEIRQITQKGKDGYKVDMRTWYEDRKDGNKKKAGKGFRVSHTDIVEFVKAVTDAMDEADREKLIDILVSADEERDTPTDA